MLGRYIKEKRIPETRTGDKFKEEVRIEVKKKIGFAVGAKFLLLAECH